MIIGDKTFMKHPLIERYGEYAIDLGIQNEMNTELNMSPEGKIRRQALHQKAQADKYFEEFSKKYKEGDQKTGLNLTLKK